MVANILRWSAVCRGATLFSATGRGSVGNIKTNGLPQIRSRVSRLSYGWTFMTKFEDGVHDPRDKKWDEPRRKWMADNQMQCIIKRVRKPRNNYVFTTSYANRLEGRKY